MTLSRVLRVLGFLIAQIYLDRSSHGDGSQPRDYGMTLYVHEYRVVGFSATWTARYDHMRAERAHLYNADSMISTHAPHDF